MKNRCFLFSVPAALLLLAGVLTFPALFGFSKAGRVAGITKSEGYLLLAELPKGVAKPGKRAFIFSDLPVLFEDGRALGRPVSSAKEITNAGRGRYRFRGSEIQFSTSDGGSAEGREYTVRSPLWSVGEPWLLALWAAALVGALLAARQLNPGMSADFIRSPAVGRGLLVVSAAWTVAFCFVGPFLSDAFFTGLLAPSLWALLIGLAALHGRAAGRAGLFLLALLPALAGYFYYGVNAASDSSFLVAGVIPWSDAKMHFLQSAGIALNGSTGILFNGRFLYPVFYAGLLVAAGWNIQLANLLVSALAMVALAFTCPSVAKRMGVAGTAIYSLLFWLYFRAHGCGLLMSENLGLLLGLIGFSFLLLSVDGGKAWPVFVAVAFFALGSAARPGALFILPALVLYGGIRVWNSSEGRKRVARTAGAAVIGLAVTCACFGTNQVLMKAFYRGEGRAFGNFAFTLHGLLDGTKWSASYEATKGDAALVMRQNIRMIQESPGSLWSGIRRAYGEAAKDGFLFRFGGEKRLATTGMLLFVLGAVSPIFWRPFRRDLWWMVLLFAGILASVPFAPPWDAGVRPYAATLPVQCFLAAAGFSWLVALLGQAAKWLEPAPPGVRANCSPEGDQKEVLQGDMRVNGLVGFGVLCMFLTLLFPLVLKFPRSPSPAADGPPVFRAGSRLFVTKASPGAGSVSQEAFLDRLSDFQAQSPDAARVFLSANPDFVLAIDWRTLQAVLLHTPLPDVLPHLTNVGGVVVEDARDGSQ